MLIFHRKYCTKHVHSKYRPWRWPWFLLCRITRPVSPGVWLINLIVQRIFRVNSTIPWMVHYTSTAIGKITIGRNVWKSFAVSGGCYIQGMNGVFIDDDVIIAPSVTIISANHNPTDISKWIKTEPVRIGKRCWIGANAVILPGVQLGDGVIVGAGAVVTKSFPSGAVVGGVPAKIINICRQEPNGSDGGKV